ncbi:hypothetical protein GGI25_006420 [Coemansia spiralis]|uniref:Amino acid transporter n=2 Tax=Coemansia TaxID=4863 RepID=A0A9W8G1C7_9FUNG|nr:hypothetical protein EDC05_005811 [Coemansia umbellata]KAJ2619090.1 hypothetical protein GGI26_006118 [Coemansia sp. RSA 1358]KAJ2668538.1 hypothetical protein GGI25_006420 [Coemansia spiralis]
MSQNDIPLREYRILDNAELNGQRRSSIGSPDYRSISSGQELELLQTAEALEQRLGLWSGMAIVIGTIIGSGIFSTPSFILDAVGSVGMSMAVWVIGAAVSVCGCAAYMELGTMLPRSGGEKEYLDTAYPRPRALLPFLFCLSSIFICGPSALAADSVVTGTYFLYAATGRATDHSEWAQRLIGLAVALFCTLLHGFFVRGAIRLQSALTVIKVLLLLLIVVVGFAIGLMRPGAAASQNFSHAFAGTSTHPSAYSSALFKVFFAYSGYTSLNYSIDELKNPVHNLPRAALGGLLVTATLYVLSNAAYFFVLDPAAIHASGTAVAGVFFTKAFGESVGQRVVPVLIGLATLGNVMCGMFSASRIIFEAAREGYLPFDRYIGKISNFQSPLCALMVSFLLTILFIVTPPPGEAYNFLIDIGGYPLWLFYGLSVVGLLVLRRTRADLLRPFKTWNIANAVTIFVAMFMCIVPFVKPESGNESIPYWAAPLSAVAFVLFSCILWYIQIILRCGLEVSYNARHQELK